MGKRELVEKAAFSSRPPIPARPTIKECSGCGVDLTTGWRYKDSNWNYWCRDCRENKDREERRAALGQMVFRWGVALIGVAFAIAVAVVVWMAT